MLVLLCVATRVRTNWTDLQIAGDWPWFFRHATELAYGLDRTGQPPYLYTSAPSLVFALLSRLIDDPTRMLQAWSVWGSLAAPVSYLATRRLAGPAAGVAVGLLVAFSCGDVAVTTGIKSPYAVSLFTACLALGLLAARSRRPWGPPLMVTGALMAACHHVGLAPMATLACLLAGANLYTFRHRHTRTAAATAAVAAFLVVGFVVLEDGANLRADLAAFDTRYPTSSPQVLSEEPRPGTVAAWWEIVVSQRHPFGTRARAGLNANTVVVILLGVTTLAGCIASIIASQRELRTTRRRARERIIAKVLLDDPVLQLLALFLAGLLPYLRLATSRGHFEAHHLVALLPLSATAVVAAARLIVPARPKLLRRVTPAAVVVAWIGLVEYANHTSFDPICGAWSTTTRLWKPFERCDDPDAESLEPRPPTDDETYSFASAADLAVAIRADARRSDQRPVVFGWFDTRPWAEPGLYVNLVQELALSSWSTFDLAPACYLVVRGEDAGMVDAGQPLPAPDAPFAVFAYPDCEALGALQPWLCDPSLRRVVSRRQDGASFPNTVMPCASSGFRGDGS